MSVKPRVSGIFGEIVCVYIYIYLYIYVCVCEEVQMDVCYALPLKTYVKLTECH